MAFKSIQTARRRLADEVYEQIIDAIKRRDIGPQDRLVQEKLAAELEISRTPVREALMRLEQEGVLELSPRGGFRLYQMDDREIRELYQSRAAVEGQAVRILASQQDTDKIADLRETIAREEEVTDTTARAYFDANRNIHRRFVELAENRYLLDMFDMIWGKAMAFPMFATIENVDLASSLGDHMTLLEPIVAGDKTEALEVLTRHIEDGFNLQIKGLHSEP